MPIDPSIPLQVQPIKLESPMNQLAMMNEALKYGEMTRGIDTQNKLRELYSQGVDVSTPEGFKQLASVDPASAMKLKTQALEDRKLGAETGLKEFELKNNKINTAITRLANLQSPQEAAASIAEQVQSGDLPPERAQQLMQQLKTMPFQQFKSSQLTSILSAKDNLTMAEQARHNKTTEGIQALAYDPTRQGQIAEARKIGEAKAELGVQPAKDVKGNIKALQTAGYDPITGKDNISDLINKSTSGAVQTGAAALLGGANVTTSGQKAIGQLETISKTMMLDLTGGKLGAGISNDDRKALEARFGEIGNSMIPAGRRLAAWSEAKDIMRRAAMLPEPQGEGETAPATTKSGASTSNW